MCSGATKLSTGLLCQVERAVRPSSAALLTQEPSPIEARQSVDVFAIDLLIIKVALVETEQGAVGQHARVAVTRRQSSGRECSPHNVSTAPSKWAPMQCCRTNGSPRVHFSSHFVDEDMPDIDNGTVTQPKP